MSEHAQPVENPKMTDPTPLNLPETERISAASPIGTRTYEDLDGGVGREVNFRPERYLSAEFGAVGAMVTVAIGDGESRCELHDVSQNGVAFEWRQPRRMNVGDTIPLLTVSFGPHEAYHGTARVGSVRQVDGSVIVGASFLDTLMNIDDVLQLRDVKAWQGRGPGLAFRDRPWRLPGHEKSKALIAELRLLCVDAQQELGELERSLPWHVVHGDQDIPAREALIERVRTEVVSEILTFFNAIGELLKDLSPDDHQAMKEYSVRQLHEFFMQSPWIRRAREKPLGYPGDYELMNGIYGNGVYGRFSGSSLFAKTINLTSAEVPSSIAVINRKDFIRDRLSELLDHCRPAQRPIRILSIAAGPAQEVFELLEQRYTVPYPVEIVLFDQDKRALAFAYGRLKGLAVARSAERVKIIYLHDAIKRLLRDAALFSSLGEFDAVFASGLFDYLPDGTAVKLAANLYANLAPGGTLYIGNMTPLSTSRWFLEFHTDWYLIYRELPQMLALARAAAPSAHIEIREEPTGINPFVTLTRD